LFVPFISLPIASLYPFSRRLFLSLFLPFSLPSFFHTPHVLLLPTLSPFSLYEPRFSTI
jgi:hypothetical protein